MLFLTFLYLPNDDARSAPSLLVQRAVLILVGIDGVSQNLVVFGILRERGAEVLVVVRFLVPVHLFHFQSRLHAGLLPVLGDTQHHGIKPPLIGVVRQLKSEGSSHKITIKFSPMFHQKFTKWFSE